MIDLFQLLLGQIPEAIYFALFFNILKEYQK